MVCTEGNGSPATRWLQHPTSNWQKLRGAGCVLGIRDINTGNAQCHADGNETERYARVDSGIYRT